MPQFFPAKYTDEEAVAAAKADADIADAIARLGYVDRGDPAAYDFGIGDLTVGEGWQKLDLSGIVPAGAKAVELRVAMKDNVAGSYMYLRKYGNVNSRNAAFLSTQVANLDINFSVMVTCNISRWIAYLIPDITFITLNIVVRGWFV